MIQAIFLMFLVSIDKHYKIEDIGNVQLSVSNYGIIGNGFSRSMIDPITQKPYPSGAYPKNSEVEHVYRGGIWVGAVCPCDGRPHVSTALVNNAYPTPGASAGFEFYPPFQGESGRIDSTWVRSSLITSPYYDPTAVSEEDLYATYFDYNHFPNDTLPYHTPLGLRVEQATYAWSYSYINDDVFLLYTIHNDGIAGALDSVYVSLYIELATGSREFWGSDFATTPYFQHKRILSKNFENGDTLFSHYHMFYERNDGYDYIAAGKLAGVKFLGMEYNGTKISSDTLPDSLYTSFTWWTWNANRGDDPDSIRYKIMSLDTVFHSVDDDYVYNNGYPDPIPMVSVGPFKRLKPGDSITIAFALVFGTSETQLKQNGDWAQKAFESNYVLPAPPPSPRLVAMPLSREVVLYFDNAPEFARDPAPPHLRDFEGYRIYRGLSNNIEDSSAWILLAQFDKTKDDTITDVDHSQGFNHWFSESQIEDTGKYTGYYKFSDIGVKNGFTYYYAVTSYDVGNKDEGLPSLESSKGLNLVSVVPATPPNNNLDEKVGVYPNPYRGHSIWETSSTTGGIIRFFNLPSDCTIYIFNQGGDIVKTLYHKNSVSGEEVWNLLTDHGFDAAPGLYIYVVKDNKTGKSQKGKFSIIR